MIYPIVAAAVLTALSVLDTTMFTILIIYCSSPTIVTITMLAKQAGVNDEYATASVIISSMISLFTIPFVMWLVTSVLF